MENEQTLICNLCSVPLEKMHTDFEYLGHSFHADTLRCPQCGQVYLPEELVRGRMAEVEYELEDK